MQHISLNDSIFYRHKYELGVVQVSRQQLGKACTLTSVGYHASTNFTLSVTHPTLPLLTSDQSFEFDHFLPCSVSSEIHERLIAPSELLCHVGGEVGDWQVDSRICIVLIYKLEVVPETQTNKRHGERNG